MILYVFSVHDKAVNAFLQPFYCRSKGEAIRSFTEAVNDKSKPFGKHALDYALVSLGEFDDVAGQLKPSDPVRVVSALEVIEQDDVIPPR